MQRISVVGSSGAGKSTMARGISERLGIPHLELDSVYHQPDWTPLPDDEFRERVGAYVAADAWVVDGNYTSHGVNDIVWSAADTVVWMDLPRSVVISRVSRRAVHRATTKQELWNGNTESWRSLMRWDPEENIVLWSWTRFASTREKYERKVQSPEWRHLTVHRIRSRSEARAFLAALED